MLHDPLKVIWAAYNPSKLPHGVLRDAGVVWVARKRYPDEDVLRLLREIDVHFDKTRSLYTRILQGLEIHS